MGRGELSYRRELDFSLNCVRQCFNPQLECLEQILPQSHGRGIESNKSRAIKYIGDFYSARAPTHADLGKVRGPRSPLPGVFSPHFALTRAENWLSIF